MDDTSRSQVAEALEQLADQQVWNPTIWQRCYDLVQANIQSDLLACVADDLIHYSGEFHSRNLLGFRLIPNGDQIDQYRREFRDVAASLRSQLSLREAQDKYGF